MNNIDAGPAPQVRPRQPWGQQHVMHVLLAAFNRCQAAANAPIVLLTSISRSALQSSARDVKMVRDLSAGLRGATFVLRAIIART